MKAHYTLSGGQFVLADIAMYGNGANIVAGAAIMRGVTETTNFGFGIVATGALAYVLGVMEVTHTNTSAGTDSKIDGTAYTYLDKEVCVNPDCVYLAEHTAPATSAIAIATMAGTSVTVTSLEQSMAGSWFWGSDNQLQYIVTQGASTTAVTKTASGWIAGTTTLTRLTPDFAILVALSSDATKIKNAAGAGSGKVAIYRSFLQSPSIQFQRLDPTKHSGVTSPGLRLFQDILFQDHAFANRGAS